MPSNLTPGYPATIPPLVPRVGAGSGGPYLQGAAAFAGLASGTVTVGGTPSTSNTVVITINGHAVTYTLVSGDTTNTITATHVAAALNADSTDTAIITATASGAVVTIVAKASGLPGQYSLTSSGTGGTTATASDTELDYAANVYIALTTFAYQTANSGTKSYYKGVSYYLTTSDATYLRAQGLIQ